MNIWPRIKSKNLWLATLGGALLLMAVVVNRETDPPSTRLATPGYSYAVTSPLKGWLDPRLRRKPGETDMPLASRLNKEIFNARYHCDFRETSRLIENIAALTFRDRFREVGLLYPEHLCGFCHQSAYILSRAMTNNGIDAIPLGLNGHVVTLMSLDGTAWLFDPDFGLGPFEYGDAIWGTLKIITDPFWVQRVASVSMKT